MPWAYILECRGGSLYVGSTHDLVHRIREHQRGTASKYTKRKRPLKLVWAQEFGRDDEAFTVEQQLKGWSRAKKIALIEGRFGDLPGLSWRGPATPSALAPDVRRRIDADARAAADEGSFAVPSPQGFEMRPIDAATLKGERPWTPRAVRRARGYRN